jgi:Protein kinase domain/WD domain, G-beta repeat
VSDLPGQGFPVSAAAGIGPGSRVAGYWVEGELGHGGMAVVFRARDERLGRTVALKVLAPALAADEGFRQRFLRESRAAAAVDDPHIIPVFEAGQDGGVLFIAMRFVSGGDVRSLLRRDGVLPAGQAAGIISPVAAALDAAHEAGLVHRDVKPANMLLDTRPGRPDHVYLSDFGLSKGALSSAGLTGTGLFLGTPDYISPEQVAGRPTDGQADQYALACAAFELLSGAVPFSRDHGMAVIYAHLHEPPPALTARRPDLPAAVDAVLSRALAKDPVGRYPSCGGFADALRAALDVRPYDTRPDGTGPGTSQDEHPATLIAATPPGSPEAPGPGRAGKASPAGAGGPSDHAATVTSGHVRGGGTGRTVRDTGRSDDTAARPEPAAASPRPRGGRAGPGRPRRFRRAAAVACVIGAAAAVPLILASTHTPRQPRTQVPVLSVPLTGTRTAALTGPRGYGVNSVAFGPGGTTLATGDSDGGYDGSTYLWDLATGKVTATLHDPGGDHADSVAFGPGGTTLAVGDSDGSTYLWDLATRTVTATLTDPGRQGVTSVAFGPGGTTLATGDEDGSTYLWHLTEYRS